MRRTTVAVAAAVWASLAAGFAAQTPAGGVGYMRGATGDRLRFNVSARLSTAVAVYLRPIATGYQVVGIER